MPKSSESVRLSIDAVALFRLHLERHGQVEVETQHAPSTASLRELES